MTCGQFPFDDRNKEQLLRETTSGKLNFPKSAGDLSKSLKALIGRMLTPNRHARITLEDVLKHPWLTGSASCNENDASTIGQSSVEFENYKNQRLK